MNSKRNTVSTMLGATALISLLVGCNGASQSSDFPPIGSNRISGDQLLAWADLPLPPFPGSEGDGGTRDGLLCLITPGYASENGSEIWSDRPLLVWSEQFVGPNVASSVATIAVLSVDEQTELWSQSAKSQRGAASNESESARWTLQEIVYGGEALGPGKVYAWVVRDGLNRRITSAQFQVMTVEQQQAIATDLAELEQELTAKDATVEEIALAKADYFASQELWSDMLQVVFAVEDPSQDLVDFRNQIPEQVCSMP
jgi:hypothetical protein